MCLIASKINCLHALRMKAMVEIAACYQNGGKPQSAFEQKRKNFWYGSPSIVTSAERLGLRPQRALRPSYSVIEPEASHVIQMSLCIQSWSLICCAFEK